MKTTLLALTLNEIEGVQVIMPQIDKAWFDQILIVDGGSTDGTIEWARDNGYDVYIQQRKGIRFAYLEVLPQVIGDVILCISPDGNCPTEAIPKLLDKMREGYDLVIGSRYLGDATSDDDDIVTGFGNWLFTRTVNALHGASYTDAMVIYRAFTSDLISDLDLDKDESYLLPEKLFRTVISWEPLMSVRAAKTRKRIGEVAVGEPPRIGGNRKLQVLRWGAAYYFQFWRELWYWRVSRSERRARAALRRAGLPSGRTLEKFELWGEAASESLKIMSLGDCNWIRQKEGVLLQGPDPRRRTHLAIALGVRALQKGFSVAFYDLNQLFKAMRASSKAWRGLRISSDDLLIIDGVGRSAMTRDESDLFYRLVSNRYRRGATLVIAHRNVAESPELLAEDVVIGDEMLRRLLNRGQVVNLRAGDDRAAIEGPELVERDVAQDSPSTVS